MNTLDEPTMTALRAAARSGDPQCKILRAAHAGTGCRLSADDVAVLANDDAIETAALQYATGGKWR